METVFSIGVLVLGHGEEESLMGKTNGMAVVQKESVGRGKWVRVRVKIGVIAERKRTWPRIHASEPPGLWLGIVILGLGLGPRV